MNLTRWMSRKVSGENEKLKGDRPDPPPAPPEVKPEPEEVTEPHRFGFFRLPPTGHIKGFSKFGEE